MRDRRRHGEWYQSKLGEIIHVMESDESHRFGAILANDTQLFSWMLRSFQKLPKLRHISTQT